MATLYVVGVSVCGGRWYSVVGVLMCCGGRCHVWFPASIPPSLLSRPRECPFGGPHSRGLESRWRFPLCFVICPLLVVFLEIFARDEIPVIPVVGSFVDFNFCPRSARLVNFLFLVEKLACF